MHRASQAGVPQNDLSYVFDEESGCSFAIDPEAPWESRYTGPDTNRIPRISPRSALSTPAVFKVAPVALRGISGVVAASHLERPPVPRVPCGIAEVDALTAGLPRGCLTEICGPASSGRTSLMLSAMAEVTRRGELCALVDTTDCFDPYSAAAAGVILGRILWVRCAANTSSLVTAPQSVLLPDVAAVCSTLRQKQVVGSVMPHAKVWYGRSPARSERLNSGIVGGHSSQQSDAIPTSAVLQRPKRAADPRPHVSGRQKCAKCVDQALRATDLLLQGGGFGLVVIDLGDVPSEIARRIPLTSWFRFRRAVENTPAVLLTVTRISCAKTCASLVLEMHGQQHMDAGKQRCHEKELPAHARIFTGFDVTVEVIRTSEPHTKEKKPPRPVRATFKSHAEWTSTYDHAIG